MIHPVIDLDIPETVPGLMNVQTMRQINAVLQAQAAPFYAGKLDRLDIENVARQEEWTKIPLLDTDTLRAMGQGRFMDEFCIAPRAQISDFWQAGSLHYPRTQRDITYAMIGVKRALVLAGFTAADIAHLSLPLGAQGAGQMLGRGGSDIDIGMIFAGTRATTHSVDQLDMIAALQPTGWIGDADYGIQLGHLAEAHRRDLPGAGVARILTSGAALPDLKRRCLSRLWGAEVRDCWFLPEMMMLGCEDTDCYGFRLWSDYCYAEILDENSLEPVGEGQPGLLVLSALVTNAATPFLRWNTGQIATLRSRKGGGKSPFDVFPLIQPQAPPRIVSVAGKPINIDALEGVLLKADEVMDYRLRVDPAGVEADIQLVPGAERGIITKRVVEMLYRAVGITVAVQVCKTDEIARAIEAGDDAARLVITGDRAAG